jgi:hypothetical protein
MSIFKESFKPSIEGQLEARQNALLNRSNPTTIQYFNARNAWVRMTSAVNVGGSSDVAESYVLLGGTLLNGKPRVGVGTSGTAYSTKSPVGNTHRLGMRPMPGITEINVKSLGAYGSLKEVEVKFNAWDIRQLEELELLYMRPGYSVLVEWGWAPYLKDANTLESNISFINSVLKGGSTKEAIWKEIYDKSTTGTGGNYDAVYGFVKNYGWSAREDGGYDCSTTLITMGEILESLKVNYGPFVDKPPTAGIFNTLPATSFEKTAITARAYNQNIVAGICSELYEILSLQITTDLTAGTFNGWNFYRFNVDIANKTNQGNTITKDGCQIYIALKDFVDILNKHVLISDIKAQKPLLELSVFCGEHNGGTTTPLTCLGDIQQITTDPTICLIKNANWIDPESSLGIVISSFDIATVKAMMESADMLDYWYNGDYTTTQLGVIGNIYVNLDYIYSLVTNPDVESQDKKEKNDIALYDFIKSMMSGINTAIGNVATFELHTDPVDSIVRIIDVNYTGNRDEDWANAVTIEIQKLGSIVRSYQLESQIFPEQSTMVAIGAQAQGGALGENVNTMIDFNQNLIDRIIPVKDSPRAPVTTNKTAADIKAENEEKEKVRKENLSTLTDYISKIDADFWESKGDFDANEASKYSNALKDQINYYRNNTDADNKNRAIIPTKLSIEMDGISGMIIGNIFKIPEEILPRGYRGDGAGPTRLAYVVTGLSHTVQNNDWKTKIDAQFIILDPPKGGMSTGDSKAIKAGNRAASDDQGLIDQAKQLIDDAKNKIKQLIGGGENKIPGGANGPNGRLPDSDLKKIGIGGHRLQVDAADAFMRMADAARAVGVTPALSDSYRTFAGQTNGFDWDLYEKTGGSKSDTVKNPNALRKKKGTNGKVAMAFPGTSNHGWGKAIDVSGDAFKRFIRNHGVEFGWSWYEGRSVNENWHFTYDPTRKEVWPLAPDTYGKGPIKVEDNKDDGKANAIFIGGLEPSDKPGAGYVSLDTQLGVFKEGYGANKNVKAFHHNDSDSSIISSIKANPNAIIVMYSAGCYKAKTISLIKDVNKNRIYMIEPYAKKGNSAVVGAVENGVPAKNVFVGTSVETGKDVVIGVSLSKSTSHANAPKDVGKRLP